MRNLVDENDGELLSLAEIGRLEKGTEGGAGSAEKAVGGTGNCYYVRGKVELLMCGE